MIQSQKDFFAGLLYAVVGGAFAIGATGYNLGTAARMGPGFRWTSYCGMGPPD